MILTVLKIIGIILLVIVGLLIFILGMLLFVPIRYQFAGSFYEELKADVMVKWTPVLLKATVCYNNKKMEYVVRMFGGVVMTNMDMKLSWIGKKFFSFEDEEEEIPLNDREQHEKNDAGKNELSSEIAVKTNHQRTEETSEEYSDNADKKFSGTKKSKKIRSLSEIIREKVRFLKDMIQKCMEKLKNLNQKKEQLLKVYHSKRFEVAKEDVKIYLKELLSIIKPDRVEGYLHFGMEDPADTGQILGVLAMALPLYDEFLEIQPDFMQKCIEGNLTGNGKIRLFPVVRLALKVIFNKNLIKVTKKVQTIMES